MATTILGFNITLPFVLLAHDLGRAAVCLLVPLSLLYFSLYFSLKGDKRAYGALTLFALIGFAAVTVVAPVRCPPAGSLINFAGRVELFFLLASSLSKLATSFLKN